MNKRSSIPLSLVVVFCFPTTASAASCNGTWATRTGPAGKTLQVCLDGKYTTCLRDAQRLDWPYDSAKRHCDNLRAEGRVK
jgi:hypothetical protein